MFLTVNAALCVTRQCSLVFCKAMPTTTHVPETAQCRAGQQHSTSTPNHRPEQSRIRCRSFHLCLYVGCCMSAGLCINAGLCGCCCRVRLTCAACMTCCAFWRCFCRLSQAATAPLSAFSASCSCRQCSQGCWENPLRTRCGSLQTLYPNLRGGDCTTLFLNDDFVS